MTSAPRWQSRGSARGIGGTDARVLERPPDDADDEEVRVRGCGAREMALMAGGAIGVVGLWVCRTGSEFQTRCSAVVLTRGFDTTCSVKCARSPRTGAARLHGSTTAGAASRHTTHAVSAVASLTMPTTSPRAGRSSSSRATRRRARVGDRSRSAPRTAARARRLLLGVRLTVRSSPRAAARPRVSLVVRRRRRSSS